MLAVLMLLDDDCERSEFEKLYNRYKNEAYHIALKILCDSSLAEDAVADAFLSVARNFAAVRFLDAKKQHGYIAVTVTNAARMILRRNRHSLDELEYDDEKYVPTEEISSFDPLWVKECMRKLCGSDVQILYLRYVLCLEHSEIAVSLGISQEASRKRLQKAKQRLAKLLKEGDEIG